MLLPSEIFRQMVKYNVCERSCSSLEVLKEKNNHFTFKLKAHFVLNKIVFKDFRRSFVADFKIDVFFLQNNY